jgi:hypothetical protein
LTSKGDRRGTAASGLFTCRRPGRGLASPFVKPLTEQEIRAAFVNCTKGEAKRANIPPGLGARPWGDLDFLGWRDPKAPDRAYLVAEIGGRLVAITLRCPGPGPLQKKTSMCSLCLTSHTGGVTLMVAPRAGKVGQQGNSVGDYVCSDLACSLYVRGLKPVKGLGRRLPEGRTLEEQIDRTVANLAAFVAKVTG